MAVLDLLISTVEKPIKYQSLSVTRTLNQRDTCDFTIDSLDNTYSPSVGQDVAVYVDGLRVFGGLVESVARQKQPGSSVRINRVRAVGYEWLADRRTTGNKTGDNAFVDRRVNDMFRSLATNELAADGIVIDDIPAGQGVIIGRAEFSYAPVSEAFNVGATLAKKKWYINPDKRLRLVDPFSGAATFTVSDATTNVLIGSFDMDENSQQYANRIIVKLNKVATDPQTESFNGSHPDQPTDGSRKTWQMQYAVQALQTLKVDGVEYLFGILNVDTGFDWYWSPGSATITQDPSIAALTSAHTLEVTYIGERSETITVENAAEIAARAAAEINAGIYERVVENSTPVASADAQQLAQSILDQFDDESLVFHWLSDTGFETANPGDRVAVNKSGFPAVTAAIRQITIFDHEFQKVRYRIEAVSGPIMRDGFESFSDMATGTDASGGGTVINAGNEEPPEIGNVTLGTPAITIGGDNVLIFIPYTPPSPLGEFDRLHIYTVENDDVVPNPVEVNVDGGWTISADPDQASTIGDISEPVSRGVYRYDPLQLTIMIVLVKPAVATYFRIYAVSGSELRTNPLRRADQSSPTPNALILVDPITPGPSGEEHAPLARNLHLHPNDAEGVQYRNNDSGGWEWRWVMAWANPTDHPRWPQLTGYDIVIQYADGHQTTHRSVGSTETLFESDWFQMGSPEPLISYLRSYSGGNINSIVAGLTPSVGFTPERQDGPSGVEFTPNPLNFRGGAPDGSPIEKRRNDIGAPEWRLNLIWNAPNDNRFGGINPMLVDIHGDEVDVGPQVGTQISPGVFSFVGGWWPMGAANTYIIYAPGMDKAWRANTVVDAVTPKIANVLVDPAQLSGGLDLTKADQAKLGANLAIAGGLLKVVNVDLADFASALAPVALFASNPLLPNSLYKPGSPGYNVTTNTLLRVSPDGNSWQKAVGANDIVANSITTGLIQAGAITTGLLAAGAVTTDKLDANEIRVGGGGNKPGKFTVFDQFGAAIGFIGVDGGVSGMQINLAGGIGNLRINATDAFLLSGVTTQRRVRINGTGLIRLENPSNDFQFAQISGFGFFAQNNAGGAIGQSRIQLSTNTGNFGAGLQMGDSAGTERIFIDAGIDPSIRINGLKVLGPRLASVGAPNTSHATASFAGVNSALDAIAIIVRDIRDRLRASTGMGIIND